MHGTLTRGEGSSGRRHVGAHEALHERKQPLLHGLALGKELLDPLCLEEGLDGLAVGVVGAAAVALEPEVEGEDAAEQAVGVLLCLGIHGPAKEDLAEGVQVRVQELCAGHRVLCYDAEALQDVGAALGLAVGVKLVAAAAELKGPDDGGLGGAQVDHGGEGAEEDGCRKDLAAEAEGRLGRAEDAAAGDLEGGHEDLGLGREAGHGLGQRCAAEAPAQDGQAGEDVCFVDAGQRGGKVGGAAEGDVGLGGDLVALQDVEHVDDEAVRLGELLPRVALQDAAAPLREGHPLGLFAGAIREGARVGEEEPVGVVVIAGLGDGNGRSQHARGLERSCGVGGAGGVGGHVVGVKLQLYVVDAVSVSTTLAGTAGSDMSDSSADRVGSQSKAM